jgi:hypothetical protein
MTTSAIPKHARPISGFPRRLITRLRYLHPPVVLLVRASRTACLHTLAMASKPSLSRLHLRDLYNEGRRYYVEPHPAGFRLTSNSRMLWGKYRERTPITATLFGALSPLGDDITCVRMHVQANWLYMLRGCTYRRTGCICCAPCLSRCGFQASRCPCLGPDSCR